MLQQFPLGERCQRLILIHYIHQNLFQEEFFKQMQFLYLNSYILGTRETRSLYISCIIFFFLEYHELFKALKLTLFRHKDSKSFKDTMFLCRFSPLCCGYCAAFQILGFILLFFLLKILHPILILVFVWNYCRGAFKTHWRRSGIFIVNFEHISHLVLVFLLLTLSK